MRPTPDAAITLIKRFEGFSAKPYADAAGFPTIGYGHLIRSGEQFPPVITESQADALLRSDIHIAERAVLRLINVPLTDEQYGALVSFTFNLGGAALQRSTLRSRLNRSDYADAADEFPKWVWAGGKKLRGLIRRREAEREMFLIQVASSPPTLFPSPPIFVFDGGVKVTV
jgi:lysozyme